MNALKITLFTFFVFGSTFAQNRMDIDSLLLQFKKQPLDTLKIKTIKNIVNHYMYRDPEQAKQFANKELEFSNKLDYDSGISLANYHLGIIYYNLDKIDSARYYYKTSLQFAKEINNGLYISKVYRGLGILEFTQGNLKTADSINNMDLENVIKLRDTVGIALSYGFKGNINQNKGFYEIGLKYALKSLNLFEKIGDSIRIADCYNHLAILEHNLRNFDKALEYNKRALAIYEDYEDIYYQAQALNDIGLMHHLLGEQKTALGFFERSIQKSKEVKVETLEVTALTNIGSTHIKLEKPLLAVQFLNDAIEKAEKINSLRKAAIAKNKLAEAYLLLDEPTASSNILDVVRRYAVKTENQSILKKTLELSSRSNEALGKTTLALSQYKQFKRINDSLIDSEKIKKIEELRAIFETEQKEAEISLQQEEIKTLNEKAKVDKLTKGLYASGMASALALTGVLVFGFRQRIKKNKAEREKITKELEHKQKELTSQTLHLVQKSQFIAEIKENLENIKDSPEKFKLEFKRLVMLLKKQSAADKDWEVFKSYFSEVHQDFEEKLKSLSSKITDKELRLAAYVKMGLNNNEIATILNVLPASIHTSKYRLKQKLNIDKDIDFDHFVKGL
ncbi:tetratricopeptide repeat protein [Flagellimonas meridianipacifica]|uniref:Regulatory LuxR family protein n=1 Tax=Flagellimonas meridianipacifica TaxID=1080225 RepID=A0A2T0MF66_9FLAO|nr:tetratricopeptide repeat protein [Allomuricauda pacifica]PRX56220.1 regulatory LuxR family protein [Allomuricauda pacifica]